METDVKPVVRLAAGQPGAVDTGLLSGTDADSLTVLDIAYGIGLGILQSDQCDLHIDQGTLRDLLVHSHDIGQQITVDVQFVTTLLKGDAVHLLVLDGSGPVGRIDLDDIVSAFLSALTAPVPRRYIRVR